MVQKSDYSRRKFLTLAGASPFLISGCATPVNPLLNRRFASLNVSPDRVIRTAAGLRPYRPSGFVVKAEKYDDITVIHNYGHGGCGVTLCWGTATLAVEIVSDTNTRHIGVLGCGAVGLATARLLQRRGYNVTIYAKDLPPHTTSNIAGALWFPTSIYEPGKVTPEFETQFNRACRISQHTFQNMVGSRYGVSWLDLYFFYKEKMETEFPGGLDLYPGRQLHRNPDSYFGYPYAQEVYAMMIDPTVYLQEVVNDFYLAGGKIVIRNFNDLGDILALPESTIVNCTGLGAGKLFNDSEMVPIKGQLNVLLPQPEIDYGYVIPSKDLLYMFPRTNEIILGGTSEYGNASLEVDSAQSERILQGHANLASRL